MLLKNPAYNSIAVVGPTATGKTKLAVQLADLYDGEILSADSRQVYRGLDIGTGKDLCDFKITSKEGKSKGIKYHLIDVADVRLEYNLFHYQKDFYDAFSDIKSRGLLPVIAGGTGMYLDAVIRGYDMIEVPENKELRKALCLMEDNELAERLLALKPDLHNKTDLQIRDRMIRAIEIAEFEKTDEAAEARKKIALRPKVKAFILGLTFPRATLRERIKKRLYARLEEGMIDEVQCIHDSGVSWQRLESLGLEYRFVSEYIQGKIISKDEFVESLYIAIGQFAKRQETWFRGMERKGVKICWIPTDEKTTSDDVLQEAKKIIEKEV